MGCIPHMKPPWDGGSGPDYSSPYKDLATAIVLLAVKDYKKTLRAIWKNPDSEYKRRKLIEESCMSIIDKAASKGIILYHGRTDDVKGWLKSTRYFVYPSYYPEGVPRCVLQAMSCGRPIITCNSPGCKKTVIENENGYLVEPKNSEDVAERMELLICDKIQAEKMGRASRNLAETVFNVRIINKIIISLVHKEEI